MKYMHTLLSLLILLTFVYCSTNKKSISKQDRNKIELLLSKHKRYAFIDLYEKYLRQEENKNGIKKCDSLFDLSSAELYNEYCLKIDFYSDDHKTYNDKNYDLLIFRWLNKNYPINMPMDNPNIKTTMALKKALDFYESADLNKYIDSLRIVFYKKHENNNLESINCVE